MSSPSSSYHAYDYEAMDKGKVDKNANKRKIRERKASKKKMRSEGGADWSPSPPAGAFHDDGNDAAANGGDGDSSAAEAAKAAKAAKAAAKAAAKKARRAERAAAGIAAPAVPAAAAPLTAEEKAARKAAKRARQKAAKAASPAGRPTSSSNTNTATPGPPHGHNFSADFNDHFETPLQAYRDLAPVLQLLSVESKTIYDPFFCKGTMVKHLASLGFSDVVNRNEDFWAVLASGQLPPFDVVITNPPYSDEDKEKTVRFVAECGKPGFVLLPSYCANKTWFKRATAGRDGQTPHAATVFAIKPAVDYQYAHIEGKGHTSSPFHSSWFVLNVDFDEAQQAIAASASAGEELLQQGSAAATACRIDDLVSVGVQFKKRLNPKQRKKLAAKKKMLASR